MANEERESAKRFVDDLFRSTPRRLENTDGEPVGPEHTTAEGGYDSDVDPVTNPGQESPEGGT